MTESKSVVFGSVVGKAEKDRLVVCSFFESVGVRFGVPFGLCSLGSGVCLYHGKRLRFRFHFSGFEVVWVCPKLDGLPDLER